MTIYLETIDPAAGQASAREALLTTPQTLALAKILSTILPELRCIENPEIQYLANCFQDYLRVDSDLHERVFDAYYEDAMAAHHSADAAAPPDAEAGALDPDARVFLGRLLLSSEIVTPVLANQMAPILGLLCGVISQYETQARRDQPVLVGPLRFAYRVMRTIALACDRAIEQSVYLRLGPGPDDPSAGAEPE